MKRPFRPLLETIAEDKNILSEAHGDIVDNNLNSKRMDFNKHRESLFGPH